MALDLTPIYSKFMKFAGDTVGDKLSVDHNGVPNVYRRKDPNRIGKYPFITVNISAIQRQTGSSVIEYFNDNDDLVTANLWDILITYGVTSTDSTTHSAEQVAFDLNSALTTAENLCLFQDLGEVVQVFDVSQNNTKRNDEVVEVASFNTQFTVYGEEVNTNTYLINTVEVDYKERYEGSDEDVATATITVTKP